MVETELRIFPTTDRSKHSKEVSYPIGTEALSHSLDGVPQHDRITCNFYAGYPQYDNGKPQFHVLHIVYEKSARSFHSSKFALERGAFDPRWKISIFAVPRHLRGAIKVRLLEQVLPEIVYPWLVKKSHLTGQTGGSALWIEYVRADEDFKYTTREDIAPERSC
jgi:hypothetical protein